MSERKTIKINPEIFGMGNKTKKVKEKKTLPSMKPLITPNKFNFLPQDYFYYKVNLDYNNKTYEVSSTSTTLKVGEASTPIKWYEYVNP